MLWGRNVVFSFVLPLNVVFCHHGLPGMLQLAGLGAALMSCAAALTVTVFPASLLHEGISAVRLG